MLGCVFEEFVVFIYFIVFCIFIFIDCVVVCCILVGPLLSMKL